MYGNFVTLQDAFRAIKELQERVVYYDTKNQDFHQRQIKNAHPSIEDYDYVVRKELKDFQASKHLSLAGGGSVVSDRYIRTFGFGINTDLVTGVDVLPPLIIPFTSTLLERIYFKCKIAPTGSSAIADINLLGTSILNSPKIVVPDGDSAVHIISTFARNNFTEGQVLTFDMTQVGSTTAGKTLVVTFKFKIVSV